MENHTRNARTLIISFVVAVMALVPLRMVELGEGMNLMELNNPVVLGETSEQVAAPVLEERPMLEAPYRAMEECVGRAEAEKKVKDFEARLNEGGWSEAEVGEMLMGIRELESRLCK